MVKKRGNSISGFSLAETLMAVLILLLVASVIAAGIPAAASAYRNTVDAANAHALLSTAVNALRSELSTAWGVKPDTTDKTMVIYYKASTGARTKLFLDSDTIMIQDYLSYDNDSVAQKPSEARTLHALVSDKAKTENLSVSYEELELSGDILTFKNVTVKNKADKQVVSPVSICIRLLNKDFEIPSV